MTRSWVVVTAVGLALGGCQGKDMEGKPIPIKGSYAKTCRNVVRSGASLSADCLDAHAAFHSTTLPADACPGKVANINGVLTCPG